MNDQTPELLDEPRIEHCSDSVVAWGEALALLDRYPWVRLYPIDVHPLFRQRIEDGIRRRLSGGRDPSNSSWERWQEKLRHGPDIIEDRSEHPLEQRD